MEFMSKHLVFNLKNINDFKSINSVIAEIVDIYRHSDSFDLVFDGDKIDIKYELKEKKIVTKSYVIGSTYERAVNIFNKMIRNRTCRCKSRDSFISVDGHQLKAVSFSRSLRGHRCDYIYIDSSISLKDYNEIILPMVGNDKRRVYVV